MASFSLVSKLFYGVVAISAVVQLFVLYAGVSAIKMVATAQGCPLFVGSSSSGRKW